MLSRTLKMAFWVFHDHLGKLIVANFIWATAVAVPLTVATPAFLTGDPLIMLGVALPCLYLGLFMCGPVFGAGIAHLCKVLIETRDGSLGDYLFGVRHYALRAMGLGLVFAVAYTLFGTSAWFYPWKLRESAPLAGYGICAICVWCIAFVAVASVLVLPTLVQRKVGVVATVKLAATLVLANPALALGLSLQVFFISVLTVLLWPAFFALYGAAVVCLGSSAYELLSRKYSAAAPGGKEKTDDAHDDYLNRGLRDLFLPWKG